MTATFSGPMFETKSRYWESVHNVKGAHYNTYRCKPEDGMAALRAFLHTWGDHEGSECFVLFSTSGVHGTYITLEEIEELRQLIDVEKRDEEEPQLTFMIIQPRLVCLRYGTCIPRTPDDFAFLKKIRKDSWEAVQGIGGSP